MTRSRVDLVAPVVVLIVAACSSGKPKVEDAARSKDAAGTGSGSGSDSTGASSMGSGSSSGSGSTGSGSTGSGDPTRKPQTTGDVQVRVEWPAMPLAARVSPGASACRTPLAAQVAPTTTWGIPEVVVFVDGAPASNAPASNAPSPNVSTTSVRADDTRIAIDRCAVTPRIAIGSRVTIASAVDQPMKASLAKRFATPEPKNRLDGPVVVIALPIAGHEVTTELEAAAIYRVVPDGQDVADGYVVGATAFITDATGVALVKDVPPGKHAVHVWLPPRGGQPARSAKGEVTVEVGDLAELTLTLE